MNFVRYLCNLNAYPIPFSQIKNRLCFRASNPACRMIQSRLTAAVKCHFEKSVLSLYFVFKHRKSAQLLHCCCFLLYTVRHIRFRQNNRLRPHAARCKDTPLISGLSNRAVDKAAWSALRSIIVSSDTISVFQKVFFSVLKILCRP